MAEPAKLCMLRVDGGPCKASYPQSSITNIAGIGVPKIL